MVVEKCNAADVSGTAAMCFFIISGVPPLSRKLHELEWTDSECTT